MKTKRRIPVFPIFTLVVLFIFATTLKLSGQNLDKLPRSNPESEGVTSSGIVDFINAVDTGSVELHSFIFIRHGKVIAEGWWKPYDPEYKHILYSASKTFTATAVGLAVSENRLKVTDKVISFFPYSLPDTLSEYMKILTVRDLLTMSVGQDPEPRSMGNNGDWITSFLSTKPIHKPGTVFKYNNMATFMLSAIVQQVTGQTVFDYLRPRLFQPLAIRGMDWDLNPQGINLGMIGLRLHTEDLAKFGQLLMQGGKWNNKQLISEQWVKEATSFKIESSDQGNKLPKDKNDWAQGYCYQMWRTRNNGFRLDGMGGQYVLLFPDKDAIVILTANARNTQDELNLVHNYLLPAIKSDKPLPPNPEAYNLAVKKEQALSIKLPVAAVTNTAIESKISGKEFLVADNEYKIQSVYFSFSNGVCNFSIKRDNQISVLKAGLNAWQITNSQYISQLTPAINNPSKSVDASYKVLSPLVKVGSVYNWTDANNLEITSRYVEDNLGASTIVCTFSGPDMVTIMPKPVPSPMGRPGFPAPQPVRLRGTLVNLK